MLGSATLPEPDSVRALLAEALADPSTAWSVGTFGAIAEFMRDPDERMRELRNGSIGVWTDRGGIAFDRFERVRPVAFETSTSSGSWSQALALCLEVDDCAMHRRTVVTELGWDRDALREPDRQGVLFDLGLGTLQVDICVRTADPEAASLLRAGAGRSVFDPECPIGPRLVEISPHRVFITRIGRAEVFQPIPSADGKSPEGPHTHVLPKLLRAGRTHAATAIIPEGWVPCAHIHPPHPLRDANGRPTAFNKGHADAFAAMFRTYSDPELITLKDDLAMAVDTGIDPAGFAAPKTRSARMCIRTTLRQLQASSVSAIKLRPWISLFDGPHATSAADDEPEHA